MRKNIGNRYLPSDFQGIPIQTLQFLLTVPTRQTVENRDKVHLIDVSRGLCGKIKCMLSG